MTPLAKVSHASASSASPLADRRAARRHRRRPARRRAPARGRCRGSSGRGPRRHRCARPDQGARRTAAMRRGSVTRSRDLPEHRREALDVAHLENDPGIFGGAQPAPVPTRHRSAIGFSTKHVDTGIDEVARRRQVDRGRHGDRDRIDRADQGAMVGVGRRQSISAAAWRARAASTSATPTSRAAGLAA